MTIFNWQGIVDLKFIPEAKVIYKGVLALV
jgi:hypothetical protein